MGLWFPERSERGLQRERASLLPGETGRATRGKRGSAAVEKQRWQGTCASNIEIGTVLGYADWCTRFGIVNQRLDLHTHTADEIGFHHHKEMEKVPIG